MTFNVRFFIAFIAVLVLEVCIALYVRDQIIRPTIGDIIAIVFVFFLIKTFIKCDSYWAAFIALLTGFAVEIGQYLNILTLLGWEQNRFLRIVLGSTFDMYDLLAYFFGYLLILFSLIWWHKRASSA